MAIMIIRRYLRKHLKDLYWTIRGRSIKNSPLPRNSRSFLFICLGNICRSPFAEHIARHLVNGALTVDMRFDSAGLRVREATPSPENAIEAAEAFGVDLRGHKSKALDREMLDAVDVTLAMEPRHIEALEEQFPDYREKFFLLPLFDTKEAKRKGFKAYNIEDPFGRDLQDFRDCYRRIQQCVSDLIEEIPSCDIRVPRSG